VWLDRGELEKLMAGAQESSSPPPSQNRAPSPQSFNGDYGERGEYGERGGYRKKRSSLFDIFD
jgi:Zn-finger nucleic acid-binding protein